MTNARVIAFYLPQFHPIPENDLWWGKGFTEWTNVGKALPLFKGHYQPRVPTDLGYYDLRMPEVRLQQAELAKEAGVESFMYWHYWFGNGRRLLEKPFQAVLESKSPNYPFCLGWANHSWTNHSWHSSTQWKKESSMIEQLYPGRQDIIAHFNNVLPAFKDERYTTVDGKPLFLVYDPFAIPDDFLETWRELAIKNGLKGIHFVGLALNWKGNLKAVIEKGFDAVNSNGQWNAECLIKGKYSKLIRHKIIEKFGGIVLDKYSFSEISENMFSDIDSDENVYPTVLPQWDRSPRSGRRASIYHGSTPELFAEQLKRATDIVHKKSPQHQILFLKSWNEWGEGNYVEPDLKFGHGYLDAIKQVILGVK